MEQVGNESMNLKLICKLILMKNFVTNNAGSYHGEHDWESKRSRSTTPLYSLYRRDGTVIPCCHERYIAFNANYSAEKPELEKEHYIKRVSSFNSYIYMPVF